MDLDFLYKTICFKTKKSKHNPTNKHCLSKSGSCMHAVPSLLAKNALSSGPTITTGQHKAREGLHQLAVSPAVSSVWHTRQSARAWRTLSRRQSDGNAEITHDSFVRTGDEINTRHLWNRLNLLSLWPLTPWTSRGRGCANAGSCVNAVTKADSWHHPFGGDSIQMF